MAAKDKKTEVVVASNTLPVGFDPAAMAADSGIGREQMSVTDMSLPYMQILQSLSPQIKKSSPQKIEDAEEGDILNTVTQELFAADDGFEVIPCAFQKAWVEWAPRETGGGWKASHADDSIMNICNRNEKGYDVRKDNGNIIMPTFYYYVLIIREDGTWEPAIISMARTQMKRGRKWNSLLSSLQIPGPNGPFNPPMFAQIYHIATSSESNAAGDWFTWQIKYKGLVQTAQLYAIAKKFAEEVSKGVIKAGAPPVEDSDVEVEATVTGDGKSPF